MIILKLAQIDDLTLDEDMMNPIEKLVKYGISGLTKVCLWVRLFYTNWKAFLGIKPLGQWQLISLGRGFYEFSFTSPENLCSVWVVGARNVCLGLLLLIPWTPNFNPNKQK